MATAFFEPLPYEVTFEGVNYKLTPSFDNVLQMYKQADSSLLPVEKLDLMLYYLIDGEYPLRPELLQQICDLLFHTDKISDAPDERSFDYVQDSPYIYAAFLQAYGVDLYAEQGKLHWLQFQALMQGLPSDTRFSEIVQIRLKPLPKPTKDNAAERAQLIRLKQQYRIVVSEEERQANLQKGLQKLAACLISRAEKPR